MASDESRGARLTIPDDVDFFYTQLLATVPKLMSRQKNIE